MKTRNLTSYVINGRESKANLSVLEMLKIIQYMFLRTCSLAEMSAPMTDVCSLLT